MSSNFVRKDFWGYILSFWSNLSDDDKRIWESFWDSIEDIGEHMYYDSQRLKDVSDPNNIQYNLEKFVDVNIGFDYAIPLKIDPTQKNYYNILPIKTILQEPVTNEDGVVEYNDTIQISKEDFYKIIDTIKGDMYVKIIPDDKTINIRYFKIIETIQSDEYLIKVEGDLRYLEIKPFNIQLLTMRSFYVDDNIIDLPFLQLGITEQKTIYYRGADYFCYGNVIEFVKPMVENMILYCPNAKIIEDFAQAVHVGLTNTKNYNLNNFLMKAGFLSIINSLKNLDSLEKYQICLNVYYQLPVSPEDGEVIGLFESFAYKIISSDKNTNNVTLDKKDGNQLHPFIQQGSYFFSHSGTMCRVVSIINRDLGIIQLDSYLEPNDYINLKLTNKYRVLHFTKTQYLFQKLLVPQSIDIPADESIEPFNHIVDIYNKMYNGKILPEIMIYGNKETYDKSEDFRGVYHIASIYDATISIRFRLYDVGIDYYNNFQGEDAVYNDYIVNNSYFVDGWFAHIPWPTPKCLLIRLQSGELFRAYMDSNVDTIFDEGDKILAQKPLTRNIFTTNNKFLKKWEEFDYLNRSSVIDYQTNILQMFGVIPGAVPGAYFPLKILSKDQ